MSCCGHGCFHASRSHRHRLTRRMTEVLLTSSRSTTVDAKRGETGNRSTTVDAKRGETATMGREGRNLGHNLLAVLTCRPVNSPLLDILVRLIGEVVRTASEPQGPWILFAGVHGLGQSISLGMGAPAPASHARQPMHINTSDVDRAGGPVLGRGVCARTKAAGGDEGWWHHQPVHLLSRVALVGDVLGAGIPRRIRVGGIQGNRLRKRSYLPPSSPSHKSMGPDPRARGHARKRPGRLPQTLYPDGGAAVVDPGRARRFWDAR
jgi:hypothetical protein